MLDNVEMYLDTFNVFIQIITKYYVSHCNYLNYYSKFCHQVFFENSNLLAWWYQKKKMFEYTIETWHVIRELE